MAAGARKYAGLPDLDEAPDIFETPELTDDASTLAPSAAQRTESRASFDEEDDDEGGSTTEGIDRRALNLGANRSKFRGTQVDASQADFSDRIASERQSYRVKSSQRRRRKRRAAAAQTPADGEEEDESTEDEDEDTPEGLRRKLARLNREAAELNSELEKRRAAGEVVEDADPSALHASLGLLNQAIAQSDVGAVQRLSHKLSTKPMATDESAAQESQGGPSYTIAYAPSFNSSHALAKAAAFDTRLTLLESMLGIDNIPLPTQANSSYPKPVLPTLDILDRQLSTLNSTSGASLDMIAKRVRQLTQEAEKLAEARKAAKDAQDALVSSPGAFRQDGESGVGNGSALDDPEQTAKINALHSTLPTIESLAPVLPGLLDRLRSLRLIHADAANASQSLAELERQQAEMDAEIAEWKESLAKLQTALGSGEAKTQENMKVVEGWVKDLAERVKVLGA